MAEPEEIAEAVGAWFRNQKKKSLQGKRLMVTAGPTREAIDPVRYISNHSSGKMGYALAEELAVRGAEVILISGPTNLTCCETIHRINVVSAQEMYEKACEIFPQTDGAIMCAAVADYTPAEVSDRKIKKDDGRWSLELRPTHDIAAELGRIKENRLLVGFALETDHERSNAQSKLEHKRFDFIVLNSLQDAGAGFGVDTNKITILERNGSCTDYPLASKRDVASEIADKIETYLS